MYKKGDIIEYYSYIRDYHTTKRTAVNLYMTIIEVNWCSYTCFIHDYETTEELDVLDININSKLITGLFSE